jgi:TolA-binding protein
VGEILFAKLDQYDRAAQHYQALLRQNPVAVEAPELLFRVGKSFFFLRQFADALQIYRDLIRKYPGTPYAEKAELEIGVTYFTKGEQGSGTQSYLDAIAAYETFLKRHPQSAWAPEARFGIASCREELDQLDEAAVAYEALKTTYPSPNVIEIKLARIRERKAQRSR